MVNVRTKAIANDAITSQKIANLAIIEQKIANLAVGTNKIANGAVVNAKLAADAVDGSKIADNSIDSEHYVDGSIDPEHFSIEALRAPLQNKRACLNTKVENVNLGTLSNLDVTDLFFQAAKDAGGVKGLSQNGDENTPGVVTQSLIGNLVELSTYPDKEPLINDDNDVIFGRVVANNIPVPSGTAIFTKGSNVVSGTGGNFLLELNVGDYITPTTSNYVGKILSVDSANQFTLEDGWQGETTTSDPMEFAQLRLDFKVINGGGSEVPQIMSNQIANLLFPQSFDLFEVPFGAFAHGTSFGSDAGGAHDHDDLYYQQSELNSFLASDGAALIGYDPSSNPHTSANNVADALDEMSTVIGTGGGSGSTFKMEVLNVTATNTIDDLSQVPTEAESVLLFLSGQLRRYGAGQDYVVSGQSITWVSPVQIVPGNAIIVFYPVSIGSGGFKVEHRGITGLNVVQPLSEIPVDPTSVMLFYSGQLRRYNQDYTISGQNINWISPNFDVNIGDTLLLAYLHT